MNDAGKIGSHTPGPWCVETRAHPGSIDICTDEHEPWFIAEVCKSVGFDGFDGEANARLIAAAPELLAAAKMYMDRIKVDGESNYQLEAYYALEAAVNKAEGR
jgi:hypothetical protein